MNTPLKLAQQALRAAMAVAALVSFSMMRLGAQSPPPPVIISTSSTLAVVDTAFGFQIEATNAPTSYAAAGLPAGLAVNASSGLISGTPTVGGVFNVELAATNDGGTGTAALALTVGTRRVFAAGPQLNYPIGMAFDGADNLYVANYYGGDVVKITPAGVPSVVAAGMDSPFMPCFDRSGNLYVTVHNGDYLGRISPAGDVSVVATGFDGPTGLALDSAGTLTMAAVWSSTVSKITPAGEVSWFASIDRPAGVAFDTAGNLYVTTAWGFTVEKVTPAGIVSTFASGFVGVDGLAFDHAGNLFVVNPDSGSVSKVTPAGVVSLFASGFVFPRGVAFDSTGALYVSDSDANTIVRIGGPISLPPVITSVASTLGVMGNAFSYQIEASGAPTSYAASGLPAGLSVDAVTGLISGTPAETGVFDVALAATNADGEGATTLTLTIGALSMFSSSELLRYPTGLAFDTAGNLTVGSDGYGTICRITPAGEASVFASGFSNIMGFAYDAAGDLFAADYSEGYIRKITPAGVGNVFVSGLSVPHGVAFDSAGDLYFSSRGDFTISKVTPAGVVSMFAPSWYFDSPGGLAFDAAGRLYVANLGSGVVSRITTGGAVTTFASGFANVWGVAFDSAGTLYVSDYTAGAIYKVSPTGLVSSLVTGINGPTGLAFDSAGALFVANYADHTISRIGVLAPVITSPATASGTYGSAFSYTITATNSPSLFAADGLPSGLAVNSASGAITGTPAQTGSFSVDLAAGNAGGTGFAMLDLLIAKAAASVTLGDLTQSHDGTPKPVSVTTDPASLTVAVTYDGSAAAPSAVGSYSVAATIDDANYAGSTSGTLHIVDTTAPDITSLTATPSTLWPANHKAIPVTVAATATDNIGVTSLRIVSITSSEPDAGLNREDRPDDIVVTGEWTVLLRAERDDRGPGRIYTIVVEARDAADNASTETVTVSVPRNRAGR